VRCGHFSHDGRHGDAGRVHQPPQIARVTITR
jgi:hypothetical protein